MEKLSYNLDFEDSKYFLLKGFLILAPHYAVKNSFSPFFKSVLIVLWNPICFWQNIS